MFQISNTMMYGPGGGNENPRSSENEARNAKESAVDTTKTEEEKPFLEKVKEALQDWSNKDQADHDFDDKRP